MAQRINFLQEKLLHKKILTSKVTGRANSKSDWSLKKVLIEFSVVLRTHIMPLLFTYRYFHRYF